MADTQSNSGQRLAPDATEALYEALLQVFLGVAPGSEEQRTASRTR